MAWRSAQDKVKRVQKTLEDFEVCYITIPQASRTAMIGTTGEQPLVGCQWMHKHCQSINDDDGFLV